MELRRKKRIKRAEAETRLPYIPEGIVVHILAKLPSKYQKSASVHLIDDEASVKELPMPEPLRGALANDGPQLRGSCNGLVLVIKPYYIVSFDPQMNEFVVVPMPQNERIKGTFVHSFGVLGGCLSMAVSIGHEMYKVTDVEVFAMKKYGDKASWTSLFIISRLIVFNPCYLSLVPLCSTTEGEDYFNGKLKGQLSHTILSIIRIGVFDSHLIEVISMYYFLCRKSNFTPQLQFGNRRSHRNFSFRGDAEV
ncbi:hypothetical protein C3L33_20445, partial [Rhododendron williamsianum]